MSDTPITQEDLETGKVDASDLSVHQLRLLRKKAREAQQEKYREESRKRLGRIAATKMRTCFVGDIAACEEVLGFLWGHGKKESDLTDDEKQFLQLWNQLRNRMLTNGNNQIRAFNNELERNTIHWDRFQMAVRAVPTTEETPDSFEMKGNQNDAGQ